jgi:hypothetical protein
MMRAHRSIVILALFVIAACTAYDPVHDQDVDALGGEAPNVPQGEFHRAGQPCTTCHGADGPASKQFSMAGTIFATQDSTVGVSGAQVLMVDSLGSSPPGGSVVTNCVGNFFITPEIWDPAFPVRVAVATPETSAQMIGHIGRQSSCASCHADPRGETSPGHIYINTTPQPTDPKCPVSNVAGATQ